MGKFPDFEFALIITLPVEVQHQDNNSMREDPVRRLGERLCPLKRSFHRHEANLNAFIKCLGNALEHGQRVSIHLPSRLIEHANDDGRQVEAISQEADVAILFFVVKMNAS